ncbi:MAG: FtsK/SpoIIIE domain-containing protein [Anaerolineae bacterium]|nr:FtsK/SpoIIIE domain-containing protein [Thermoflexales bacterium]
MKRTSESIVAGMKRIGIGLLVVPPGGRHWPVCGLVELYFEPEPGVPVGRVVSNLQHLRLAARSSDATIRQGDDRLIVQIPYGDPQRVTIESLLSIERPPFTAICGRDMYGKAIGHNFADAASYHCIIAGSTGSGKTALAHSMVMSLAAQHRRSEMALVVFNPKLDDEPWLYNVIGKNMRWDTARTPDEAVAQLRSVVDRMERTSAPIGRVVVYAEEVADLAMNGGEEAVALLTRIAQRGGSAGVHLIACTQKPKSKIMDSLLTMNIPVRYVGKVDSARTSADICGVGAAAHLLRGKGDFVKVGGEKPIRLRAAIPGGFAVGAVKPAQSDDMNEWGNAPANAFYVAPALQPSKAANLREAWGKAGSEERQLVVAEHLLENAIKAGLTLGAERGQMSKAMFVRLVAGRQLAGNMQSGDLAKLYDMATSTTSTTSTSTENPSPPV